MESENRDDKANMRAPSATRTTDQAKAQASKARKDKTLRAFKEKGLAQFSTFLSEDMLAQLDSFVDDARGTVGPDGRRVNGRGPALELILARYFAENPIVGSSSP